MKKFNVFFALAFLCIGLVAIAQEQAPEIEAQDEVKVPTVFLSLGWDSKYVSKGIVFNPDPVANFTADINYYGFYLDVWGQYDMTSYNDGGFYRNNRRYRAEEIDYRLGYAKTFDADFSPISLDIYWVYFQYPETWDSSDEKETECGVSLTLDNVLDKEGKAALALGTEVSYSLYKHGPEWLGVIDSYFFGRVFGDLSFDVCDKTTAGVKTTLYWRSHKARKAQYGRSGFVVPNVEVQPYLKYAFNDYISAKAYVAGTWAINSATRRDWKAAENQHEGIYWCGVSVSAEW